MTYEELKRDLIAIGKAADEKVTAQAALIEKQGAVIADLIEALTPFSALGEVVLAEAPADAEAVWSFASCDGQPHLIGLEAFRAAASALAAAKTLGERG